VGSIGLFGKMRSAGDFVGLRAHPGARAVQHWMQLGHELSGGQAVDEPVYFIARFQGAPETYCGVWIPSEDRVGRRFPLLTFLSVGEDLAGISRGYLPALIQPFLDAAVGMMRHGEDGSHAELERALESAPRPDVTLLPLVVQRCGQASHEERVSTFVQRLFGDGGAGQLAYALHAVALACEPLRGAPPLTSTISLDCPVGVDLDLFFWADLIHRSLAWDGEGPGLFWTEQTPRLIVALGPATPSTLSHLMSDRASGSFWPLWTTRDDALARAGRSLSARMRQVIAEDLSLQALAECF
jgi:type VI secretion system ImpM family protein